MSRKKCFSNRKKQKKIIRVNQPQKSPASKPFSPKPSVKQHTSCTVQQKLAAPQFLLPEGWSTVQNSHDIMVLCYIRQYNSHSQILFTVTVHPNLTYSIRAFNHLTINIPHVLITNVTHLITLLTYLAN